jgi:hypothetical protein
MSRVPLAEFEPQLTKRLDELWGTPPNLYRALVGRMLDAMAVPLDEGVRNYQPRLK